MEYQIKYSQFCSLAREQSFQLWLAKNSTDCYQELIDHLSISSGCKSNAKKMKHIVDKLRTIGLFDSLVVFLKKHFPLTISEKQDSTNEMESLVGDTIVVQSISDKDVFNYYNPRLLTFPHKIVLENDNSDVLKRDVFEFLSDKISYDFIIIGNRAYVEYFHNKYSSEAVKIDRKSREVFKYKAKRGLTDSKS